MMRNVFWAFGAVVTLPGLAWADDNADFFEGRVRPLLANHCFACHGPKKQMAGLRLDSKQGLLRGGANGPVVVSGHPEKSKLIDAVKHLGKLKMPPQGKLTPQAVETLSAWIGMGLPWPKSNSVEGNEEEEGRKHWAFQPIREPKVPSTRDKHWPNSDIDRFILAKLEAKHIKPSPPAEPIALLRRIYFDLIGLPPTPEEVDQFLEECKLPKEAPQGKKAPGFLASAIAKVVDRLLASPHYGERWGRHWLDVARYADTKGYVFFEDASFTWAYTYRDYVIRAFNEDLPYDRFLLEQLAADLLPLGRDKRPLAALGFLTVGGRFMNNAHDILDDRIDVVTRGLMGLTMSCARCHDHKFDPIPTTDYYGLYGVFAGSAEPTVPPLFQPPPQTEEYAKFEKELKAREVKLMDFVKAKHQELMQGARKRMAEYLLAAHALRDQPSTDDFMLIADGADLNPTMIIRWERYLAGRAKKHDPVFAIWHALGELEDKDFAATAPAILASLLKPNPRKPLNPLVVKVFTTDPPTTLKDAARRYGELFNQLDGVWQKKSGPVEPDEDALRQVFYGAEAPPNVAVLPYGNLSLLPDRASQAKFQELRGALEKWRTSGPGAPPRALTLEELPAPHDARVFLRGNPNNLGVNAPRQMPLAVAKNRQPFRYGSGRLEMALAIASRDNPLTARVLVNRVWMHHFGEGLVRTPSDFGLRGGSPSHPELLDHLAVWFMDNGWSLKKLHRAILLSRVYQQQSDKAAPAAVDASPLLLDPENRLLWHFPRRRLDFETTRDALLAVSGKLDRAIGGPSLGDNLTPNGTRRTMYSHLDRLNVPGLFRTFDYPSPDATSPQRDVTTVAPQALFLMNNPIVLNAAKHLMKRSDVLALKDESKKIDRLHRLLFGRGATREEIHLAREYVQAAGSGDVAWQRYAHALLMSNEFVTVD